MTTTTADAGGAAVSTSTPRTPRARPAPGILPALPWGVQLPLGTRGTLAWGCRGILQRRSGRWVVDVPHDRRGTVWPGSDASPPAPVPAVLTVLRKGTTAAALTRAVTYASRESRGAVVAVWTTGRWTWRVRLAGGYAYVSAVLDEAAAEVQP